MIRVYSFVCLIIILMTFASAPICSEIQSPAYELILQKGRAKMEVQKEIFEIDHPEHI